jgi:catechol 2,3-dioxygenase
VLDFEVTEQIVKEATGETLGVFLSCSNKGHDVAFISYPEPGRFHHISFYLESVQDLYRAGDLMGRYRVSVDVGPTRHGITRGATIYFFDPSGNRNEVFSGSYIRYPDMPVLTWHDTHLGYGACYPDGRLVESFLTVVT